MWSHFLTSSGGKFNLLWHSSTRWHFYNLKIQSYLHFTKLFVSYFGIFCNDLTILSSKYLDKQKSMPRLHEFCSALAAELKEKKITFVSKRFRGKSDIFFDLNKENCTFLCEKTGNKNVCQRAICRTSFYWQQCSIWGRGKIFFSLQFLRFLHMWNLSIFPSPLCIFSCQ